MDTMRTKSPALACLGLLVGLLALLAPTREAQAVDFQIDGYTYYDRQGGVRPVTDFELYQTVEGGGR